MSEEPTVGPEQYHGEDEMGDDINRRVDAPGLPLSPITSQELLTVPPIDTTTEQSSEKPPGEVIDITGHLKAKHS